MADLLAFFSLVSVYKQNQLLLFFVGYFDVFPYRASAYAESYV